MLQIPNPVMNFANTTVMNPFNPILDEGQVIGINNATNSMNTVNIRDIVSINSLNRPNGLSSLNAENILTRLLLQSKGYVSTNK